MKTHIIAAVFLLLVTLVANAETFTVASLNVDGLPKSIKVAGIYTVNLNPDAKEGPGATAIGERLKTCGWDILAVSEDFNFHSQIWNAAWNGGVEGDGLSSYNSTTHRGNISATAGAIANYLGQRPIADTDGLCLFYRHTRVTPTNEAWYAWKDHNGYTDQGADGLINKGYRFYTITLNSGDQVDVYILHMDAEDSPEDNAARASQLAQLLTDIKSRHNGNPIIVMGDTNCRYTRDHLKRDFIDELNKDERFVAEDAFIKHTMKGVYPKFGDNAIMDQGSVEANKNFLGQDYGEIVDKIIYINNTESSKRIRSKSYKMAYEFKNEQGEPLADHWPIVVEFSIEDYDPANPDVKYCYLRNSGTGKFLQVGGKDGKQAVQGAYPTIIKMVDAGNNKYYLRSTNGALGKVGTNIFFGVDDAIAYSLTKHRTEGTYKIFDENDNTNCISGKGTETSVYAPDNQYVVYGRYSSSNLQSGMVTRWYILTDEDIKAEMASATFETPQNVTPLIKASGFDRNDSRNATAWSGWPTNLTYLISGGAVDVQPYNPCSEIYIDPSVKGTTTFNISQTITNIPNGMYKVSAQGFYRDGLMNEKVDRESYANLYAQSADGKVSVALPSMYSAECQNKDLATYVVNKDVDNNLIPNDMTEASWFFQYGYYPLELTVQVTNGTLIIGIEKTQETSGVAGWTCFDNFQLSYLGDLPTEVDTISAQKILPSETPIYDLSGRKITSPVKGGLYIQNGQKVIIR